MLTPSFGSELTGGRPDTLRAEARYAGTGRRRRRRGRGVRRALGLRLVSAGLRLIGSGIGGTQAANADAPTVASHVSPGR